MEILDLALKLNEASKAYKIGDLQKIRKTLKGLKRLPGNDIFNIATINEDGWAFHYGGRSELQFNIGIEEEGIRYGLAFSLEPSQSLPDVSILYPKILRLNCLLREKPDLFLEYKFWYWHGERSQPTSFIQIPADIIKSGYFIFFGKLVKEKELDINAILQEFDKMLSIYLLVEGELENESMISEEEIDKFSFTRQQRSLIISREYTTVERETNIDVRHSEIQLKLKAILEKEYGVENVSIENPCGGNRIDAVVRQKNGFIFYEIKTASNSRSCIRQALGQILDYAYWPGKKKANQMVIVGEYPLSKNGKSYLAFINKEFSLPIDYMQLTI
jgi:hypothetical protein